MNIKKLIIYTTCCFGLLLPKQVNAKDNFQDWLQAPSNTGLTGMLEMPNARVMQDWNARFSLGYSDPYAYYSGALTMLPNFEIAGRITRSIGVKTELGDKYGDHKDKNIDLKWRIFKENSILPSIAIGANDIHGTGLYTSRYIVASKYWNIFDFTLGFGQGRLGGQPISSSSAENNAATDFIFSSKTNGKFFGGIRARLTEKFSFIAEYDTVDYYKDKKTTITQPKKSHINYGIRYNNNGMTLGIHYLRGKDFGFSLAYDLSMKPAKFYEPPYTASKYMQKKANRVTDFKKRAIMIHKKLTQRGFNKASVHCQNDYVWIEFYNSIYLSNTKAMGRVARIAAELSPKTTKTIYVSLLNSGHKSFTMAIPRDDIENYIRGDLQTISASNDLSYTKKGAKLKKELTNNKQIDEISSTNNDFNWSFSPKIESFLNDPNGFYLCRLSLFASASYNPWQNGLIKAALRAPVYSNIVDKAQNIEGIEPISVRSDAATYLDKGPPRFEVLGFDQMFDLPLDTYANASFGYLDYGYAGAGGEILKYFFDGRLAVGLEYAKAKKRDPDSIFGFYKTNTSSDIMFDQYFCNVYYNVSSHYGVDLAIKYGQFLAGDKGVKITLSRTYKYFSVGIWYTMTNGDDVFTSRLNSDYDDKGIYFNFPFRAFPTSSMQNNKSGHLGFTAWGRDVGASVPLIRPIYKTTKDTQAYFIKNDLHKLGQ